jgi:hypothetical protein
MLHHEIDWWMDLANMKKSCANRTIEGSLEVAILQWSPRVPIT